MDEDFPYPHLDPEEINNLEPDTPFNNDPKPF
jgi:hypothetical protein